MRRGIDAIRGSSSAISTWMVRKKATRLGGPPNDYLTPVP